MPEETQSGISALTQDLLARPSMTRRQVLRTMAATGVAAVGGAVLTACGSSAPGDVKVVLGTWPILFPGNLKPNDSPRNVAEAAQVKAWNAQHPNVKLSYTSIAIDTPDKLTAAIAGHKAPYEFGADATNQFGYIGKHLLKETTSVYTGQHFDTLMADYAKPLFEATFDLGKHYYALPADLVNAGWVFMVRRDILTKNTILEPDGRNWSWADARNLASQLSKVKNGVVQGLPNWFLGAVINSNNLDPAWNGVGYAALGSVPNLAAGDKKFHWSVDVTNWTDEWSAIVDQYRQLTTTDKSTTQSADYNVYSLMVQFASEQFWMVPTIALFTGFVAGQDTPFAKTIKNGQAFDANIAVLPFPNGSNGAWNTLAEPSISAAAYPYFISDDSFNAIVDLHKYMWFGDGYINTRYNAYKASGDPSVAYDNIFPNNRYQNNPKLPDLPVTAVYGPRLVQSYSDIITKGTRPVIANFYPQTETAPAPASPAHDDLLSKLSTSNADVAGALKTFQDTVNSQISNLTSDLTNAQFKQGVVAFFNATDAFWKQHAPQFYAGDWNKYYQQYVLPALQ
jgi:hypothetical protein